MKYGRVLVGDLVKSSDSGDVWLELGVRPGMEKSEADYAIFNKEDASRIFESGTLSAAAIEILDVEGCDRLCFLIDASSLGLRQGCGMPDCDSGILSEFIVEVVNDSGHASVLVCGTGPKDAADRTRSRLSAKQTAAFRVWYALSDQLNLYVMTTKELRDTFCLAIDEDNARKILANRLDVRLPAVQDVQINLVKEAGPFFKSSIKPFLSNCFRFSTSDF